MFPTIDRRATGINIRRLMDKHFITVKDLQSYLDLSSVQSIYHWLNGICLPSLDNLYAVSALLGTTIDDLICGNKPVPHSPRRINWEVLNRNQLIASAEKRLRQFS